MKTGLPVFICAAVAAFLLVVGWSLCRAAAEDAESYEGYLIRRHYED